MKSKSKLMLISSFALAFVAALAVGFAVMNVTEPVEVKADDKGSYPTTIYYYNENGWTTPYIYAWQDWGNGSGNPNADFPGVAMTKVDGYDYWYTISDIGLNGWRNRVIFSDNGANQTGNITMDTGFNCYYKGVWIQSMSDADDVGFYIMGTIKGVTNWDTSVYRMSTDVAYKGDNTAALKRMTFSAGDQFKIVYGACNTHHSTYNYANGDNYGIGTAGTYDVYLNNSWYMSAASSPEQSYDIGATYHKTSTNGQYLLLATAFDLADLTGDGEYSIGYCINGVLYDTDTYYSSITTGSKTDLPSAFGDVTEWGAPKLIVQEFNSGAANGLGGKTFTFQAYIKLDDTIVALSNAAAGTITL